jgi:hypothetical protein
VKGWVLWLRSVVLATQKAEIRRIVVPGQQGGKESLGEYISSNKKLCVVPHICHYSYTESIKRRLRTT